MKNKDGFGPKEGCLKVCQCFTASTEADCVMVGISTVEIVADEMQKREYTPVHRISPGSGKALWVRCDKRQVTLCKWEVWLSGSSKGK